MSGCPEFSHLLALPRLRVQNANAVSSPLTHGFPSMTAFLGLMWALERKARTAGLDVSLRAVGVICHDHQEQVSGSYVKTFNLTRNPVDKDGSTAAIVEEGRIHLDLTLVFAVYSRRWQADPDIKATDTAWLAQCLASLRIAGGTLLPPAGLRHEAPWVLPWIADDAECLAAFRKGRMGWLPGFALIGRDDLLTQRHEEMRAMQPTTTRLDALLSLSRFNWRYAPSSEHKPSAKAADQGKWQHDRRGWIVPIPVGYGTLGDVHAPGVVANTRDATIPFAFVESLYSVGEWCSPHRLQTPYELLWYPTHDAGNGTYRCRNDYQRSYDTNHYFD